MGPPIPHLEQRPLSDVDKVILVDVEGRLFGDTYTRGKICTDENITENWALLRTTDIV